MALEITSFLLRSLLGLYLLLVVLRFLLRASNADFYNPITQKIVQFTEPLAAPLQKLLPMVGNIDTATLVGAVLLNFVSILALAGLYDAPFSLEIGRMLLWSCIGIAYMIADIYFFLVLAVIILSWVAPSQQHPAIQLAYQLAEPVMAPLRRVIPPIGGLDLSPIALFLIINVVEIILKNWAVALHLPPTIVLGI